MSATPTHIVGVAGAPEVAAALREIGFTVITGTTFRDAAIAIAAQLKQGQIPVVVETMTEPGYTPWVLATHSKSAGVVILPTDDSVDLTGALASVPTLTLPATVNELLVHIGLPASLTPAGEIRIGGELAAPAPAPTPVAIPAPAPAPAAPVTDPFEAMVSAVPAPEVAPVVETPTVVAEPVVEAAPVVTDPFATVPAVTDPFADAAPAEAAPAPAAPDSFDAMVASVPVPQVAPAPVVEAPALGAPNPVEARIEPVVADPYAASSITGDDDQPDNSFDDYLGTFTPAPEEAPVAPAPVAEPVSIPEPAAPVAEPYIPAPVVAPAPVAEPVIPTPAPVPAAPVEQYAPAPVAEPYIPVVEPAPAAPAPAPAAPAPADQSTFIADVLRRRDRGVVAPLAPQQQTWAPSGAHQQPWATPVQYTPGDAGDFFGGGGISAGGCQVVISLAGKGGAGKTTQTLMYGQTAGSAGIRVLVIDANRDQGDIGSSLRIEKAGFPTVLESISGHPSAAIVTKDRINAARPAASQDIEFDVVLAPPREFAGARYASAQVYARLLAYAKTKYELIVIDTQIVEAQKSDLHIGFIIPELRSGAWSAGIALYDYSAIRNAFAVFDELAALGVTQQRTLVVATRWPDKESDAERFVSQFGQFGTFMGFVGDDPNVNAQKSVGNLLIGSPAIAPVVRTLLHRVTNNPAFAPIEDNGRRKKKPAAPGKERRGLFGGRK